MIDGTPKCPTGVGARARRLWFQLHTDYDFSDSETLLVVEIVRLVGRLDRLDAEIRKTGPTAVGSQGQMVVNPLLTEARGQQAVLHRLVAALRLADDDETVVMSSRQIAASTAASSRWQARKDTV